VSSGNLLSVTDAGVTGTIVAPFGASTTLTVTAPAVRSGDFRRAYQLRAIDRRNTRNGTSFRLMFSCSLGFRFVTFDDNN